MKSIILPFTRNSDGAMLSSAAATLANRFGATLTGLFVRRDPKHAIPLLGDGLTAEMIQDICDATEQEGLRYCTDAENIFMATMAKAGIGMKKSTGAAQRDNQAATAIWRTLIGNINDHVGRCARTADLAICERPKEKGSDQSEIFDDLVFRSGRSVMMMPENYDGTLLDSLLLAWNGRAECARAVGGALPVIKKARKVSVLQVGDLAEDLPTLDDIGFYLNTHGVEAEHIHLKPSDTPVGETILQTAHTSGADSIVIGAFSTARWRERILGGVTRHLIESSDIPIYMSH